MSIATTTAFQCISARDAANFLLVSPNVSLFDVRDVASYQQSHIAAALHLSETRLSLWIRRLPKDAPVLIYCYHGNASKTYAQTFADFGFTDVYSVDGGYAPFASAIAAIT